MRLRASVAGCGVVSTSGVAVGTDTDPDPVRELAARFRFGGRSDTAVASGVMLVLKTSGPDEILGAC